MSMDYYVTRLSAPQSLYLEMNLGWYSNYTHKLSVVWVDTDFYPRPKNTQENKTPIEDFEEFCEEFIQLLEETFEEVPDLACQELKDTSNNSHPFDACAACEDYFFDHCEFIVQSGNSGINVDPQVATDSQQQEVVGFTDMDNNVVTEIPHDMTYTNVDASQNAELGSYLKRPVKIHTENWTIGASVDAVTFDPWNLFFDKASIKKKLDNYYMVRCNLHLKFVVNASPFYYGCLLAAYQPLSVFTPVNIITSVSNKLENVSLSQRPHLYMYPQDSQGGEMVLPFLYHKNWINATSAIDLSQMGTVRMESFGNLMNANGLTTDTISIVVYAWAEDVEVAGPTITYAVQSKDEYGQGSVSKPASAVARAASMFEKVPVIGPFATATSLAAGAVSSIASLFGFTNVPVIEDVKSYMPKPFGNFASTDIGTPVEKLTLDAKNELSIDPKIAGTDVTDELIISSFVSREAWIWSSSWTSNAAADTSLFLAKVSPMMVRTEAGTNQTTVWTTPLSHVAQCFSFWRGDIIFRFKFICSKYHRGRVRINWDPIGDIGVSGDYTTETYTQIVDITQETDVEFRVPYTQPTAYLETANLPSQYIYTSGTGTTDVAKLFNGILTLRVLNPQTSPVSSADITILTFVRGAENLEFAGPRNIQNNYSPYTVQSKRSALTDNAIMDREVNEYCLGVAQSETDPNINSVYMGEYCVSLRQLMRRQGLYHRGTIAETSAANQVYASSRTLSRSPLYPGFDTNGIDSATGITVPSTFQYNYVGWHYATWFSTCFVGSRGSYIYHVNPCATLPSTSVRGYRATTTHPWEVAYECEVYAAAGAVFKALPFKNAQSAPNVGLAGQSITNQRTLAGVSFLAPFYSRYKFMSNGVAVRTEGGTADDSSKDSIVVEEIAMTNDDVSSLDTHFQDLYVGIGTDFNLVFFLNTPALYYYNSMPTAV